MKITVITVSYNSATTIADTIRSVASQTYKNIEHFAHFKMNTLVTNSTRNHLHRTDMGNQAAHRPT